MAITADRSNSIGADGSTGAPGDSALSAAQSLLFVPATRPERFAKAIASGAGAIIIDLEDAVAPGDKDTARNNVTHWLAETFAPQVAQLPSTGVVVRVNSFDSEHFDADVAALAGAVAGIASQLSATGSSPEATLPLGVMIPKTENTDAPRAVERIFNEHGAPRPYIFGLIETPLGVVRVDDIAASGTVDRLAFGNYDFALELGATVTTPGEPELLLARSRVVLAARAFGLPGAVDGPCADFTAPGATEESAAMGKRLGFSGKLAIHPKQIALIAEAFGHSPEEITWARTVVEAAAAADGGAVKVDGAMVDAPVLERARRIVAASAPTDRR